MGDIDIHVRNFVRINSVFAQLFDQGVFDGRIQISPDSLQEMDTLNQETLRLEDGQLRNLERLRDVQKTATLFHDRMAFRVILGVEAQTGIHYYMPVRCMEYDALSYTHQCRKISEEAMENRKLKKFADGVPKGSRILPTVTLVFYVGRKPWDGPASLHDMLDIPETMREWAGCVIPDYRMNLIDAAHMSEGEIEKYEGDLKAFLLMLHGCCDREKLKTAVAMHRETWYAVSAVRNDRRYAEYIDSIPDHEMAGGVNMDATLDYIEAKGEKEGIDKVNALASLLLEDGRMDDFIRSIKDKGYQRKLFQEYGLERL